MEQVDVLVVGAGLAGLYAARELKRGGLRVRVVEARDRVGGRTWTAPIGGVDFDLGGQWIGPAQRRMTALVAELGLSTTPTWHEGRKVFELGRRVSTYQGTIPRAAPWTLIGVQAILWRLDRLCRTVDAAEPWRSPNARALDAQTVAGWLRRTTWNPEVGAMVNAATRVIFGADVGELSLLHFLWYVHSGGGLMQLLETHGGNQDARIDQGAQAISRGLAEGLDLRLEEPVTAIDQGEDGVRVTTREGEHRAGRVVVAVPPPMTARIRCSPALPTLRSQLVQRAGMGATVKCYALYDAPFWRAAGRSGEGASTEGPVGVTFDAVSPSGQAALLGFVVGAPARGWSERPAGGRRDLVLGTFARWFGEEALRPTAYLEVDWATEEFSGGAPIATFPPGTLSVFGPALRAPVGRIHWAGTETARESTGFMEGALESGERVAAEILARSR